MQTIEPIHAGAEASAANHPPAVPASTIGLLDRLLGVACWDHETGGAYAGLPDDILPEGHRELRDVIRWHLDNAPPSRYCVTRQGVRDVLKRNGRTGARISAVTTVFNKGQMAAATHVGSDGRTDERKKRELIGQMPAILDQLRNEAKRIEGLRKVTEGVRLLADARADKRKIENLQRAVAKQDEGLVVVDWDSVEEGVDWLWPDCIPLGGITLFAGIGGLGKSTATIDFAAAITSGGSFPDGTPAPEGDVIIFSAEDANGPIKQRARQQGMNFARFHKLEGSRVDGETRYFDLSDLDVLRQAIARWPDTKAIIIDPIASYVSGIDAHKNADVRRVMTPLTEFAEQHRIAVILVIHLSKDEKKSASNRISGSGAWRDLSRSVWFVVEDKREASGNHRLFLHDKNNYGPKSLGFGFSMEGGIVKWTGAANITLEEAMRGPIDTSTKVGQAEEFLFKRLKHGPVLAKELLDAGEPLGLSKDALHRAKEKIGVAATRKGFGGAWEWSLPQDDRPF